MNSLSLFSIALSHERDHDVVNSICGLIDSCGVDGKIYTNKYNIKHNGPPAVPILPIYQLKYKTDNVFVWDVMSLELLLKFSPDNRILYFISDIPWLNTDNSSYDGWLTLFGDSRVSYITNKKEIAEIFKMTLGIESKIFQNPQEFLSVISKFIGS